MEFETLFADCALASETDLLSRKIYVRGKYEGELFSACFVCFQVEMQTDGKGGGEIRLPLPSPIMPPSGISMDGFTHLVAIYRSRPFADSGIIDRWTWCLCYYSEGKSRIINKYVDVALKPFV